MEASGTPTPPPAAATGGDATATAAATTGRRRKAGRRLARARRRARARARLRLRGDVDRDGRTSARHPTLRRHSRDRRGSAEGEDECFDGSSAQKTATIVLGWPSGVLAGIAALVALYFAFTGRSGRLLLQLTGAAIALGVLSILIGSV